MQNSTVPADVLDESDDARLAWLAIAPAFEQVDIHAEPALLSAALAKLSPGQRALLALHWTVSEVANGGFAQFFDNGTGVLALEALAGARRIGAPRTAKVVEAALRAYGGETLPSAAVARRLDERLYSVTETELYPKAAQYVRARPQEFTAVTEPTVEPAPPVALFTRTRTTPLFDFQPLALRCNQAAVAYRALGGQASVFGHHAPASEAQVRSVEERCQATLPPTLRALALTTASLSFHWSLPAEAAASLGSNGDLLSGGLRWDLDLITDCEQLRRAWTRTDFRDRSVRRHHLWHDALPLQHLEGGEFLAVDLLSATGEEVVFLHPRFEGLHGVVLAPTYGEFLDRLSRLGAPEVSPRQLARFVTPGVGLDPDGPAATEWLESLNATVARRDG